MKPSIRLGMPPARNPGIAIAALTSLLPCLLAAMPFARAADPSDPGAAAPGIIYRSAFDGYEGWRDGPKASWRDANDAVGRLGGHMGHLEEAPAGERPAGEQAPTGQTPGDAQHQHHKP